MDGFVAIAGRRAGKSRALLALVIYIAALCEHPKIVKGETGIVLLIAPDQKKQAGIIFNYISANFSDSPILKQLVVRRTADTIELDNGVSIDCRAASFRRLRGPTYVAVIADECAFFMSDEYSANAYVEIINAIRPGLATTSGPLILASSPYAKRGILWDAFKRDYGKDGDPRVLVAKGPTLLFNQSLDPKVVHRALARDHAAASAEYLARVSQRSRSIRALRSGRSVRR